MQEVLAFLGDPSTQWIWAALQAVAVIGGFTFIIRQIVLARQQNSIAHLNYFREIWVSPPLLRARFEISAKGVDADGTFKGHEDALLMFMNDLGAAVRAGQADIYHVWSFFGYYAQGYWAVLEGQVQAYRKRTGAYSIYQSFEFLIAQLDKQDAARAASKFTLDRAAEFLAEEMTLAAFYIEAEVMSNKPSSPTPRRRAT